MRIIFFGTPKFSANLLLSILSSFHEVIGVVTMPDKPQGRKAILTSPSVKTLIATNALEIPVYQPEKASDPYFVEVLKKLSPEILVVAAFGQIFKENLLNLAPLGCINVHTSLLPKYRGAAPIQRAIMEGEKETGISIMHMVKKLDAGNVILQKKITIAEDVLFGELEEKLCVLSKEALLEALTIFKGKRIEGIPQDDSLVTYAKKIEKEDCMLNFQLASSKVYNTFRGVSPRPGAWFYVSQKGKKKRIKAIQISHFPKMHGKEKSILFFDKDNGFVIACNTGALKIETLQLEGKKAMDFQNFIKGCSSQDFKIL